MTHSLRNCLLLAGPIFTKFPGLVRTGGLDKLVIHLTIHQGMATNFGSKVGEIHDLFSFVVMAFQNGLQYRNSDFNR